MAATTCEQRSRGRIPRWGRRIVVVGLLSGVLFTVFHVMAPTSEEKLAALDVDRAVPDEDNAAIIYEELVTGEELPQPDLVVKIASMTAAVQDPVSVCESRAWGRKLRELEPSEAGLDPNVIQIGWSRPWRSDEYPQMKQWLDRRGHRIDRLLEAARKPSCCFPLWPAPGRMALFDVPLGALRQNVNLLVPAANNDLAEGDVDGALAKWRALMAVGRHLRGQPGAYYLLNGIAVEALALHQINGFVIEGPATEGHLQDLAVQCERPDRECWAIRREINHVRSLFLRLLEDPRSLKVRLYMRYQRIRYGDGEWPEGRCCELYHRMLSDRRGVRILIELRRFKDRTGRWPESLDSIAAALPSGTLVDPINDGPYVYRLSERGFSLYSTGPNRVDESGRPKSKSDGPDDWPIWPPRGRGSEPEQEKR